MKVFPDPGRWRVRAGLLAVAVVMSTAPALNAQGVQLVNETVVVDRGGVHTMRISLQQRPAAILFRYRLVSGGEGVRAILVSEQAAEQMRRGEPFPILATTPFGPRGQLLKTVPAPGDYELVFDNTLETSARAVVRWQTELLFNHPEVPEISYLSRGRRAVVVAFSGFFLLAMTVFTAGRLKTALAERRMRELHSLYGGYPPPNEPPT